MDQSTDQIRREIDLNRQGAAEKIDQIQAQVQDTADQLRSNVQGGVEDTIDSVKGAVDETMQGVKQGIENFDVRQTIEERPLVALGAALISGFVLGGMMGGDDHRRAGGTSYATDPGRVSHARNGGSGSLGQTMRTAMQKTGLDETVSNAAAALIGSVTDQVKDTIDRNFPGFADKMQTARQAPGGLAGKTRETRTV
jgi:ElaB/YqjD/DUF883 family membrane-anchored ribosome-binding protein